MALLPRLALATQPSDGPTPAGLALLEALTRRGHRVQHFGSRACPAGVALVGSITGLPSRPLDPWLMSAEACRSVFARGFGAADLAIVEGAFEGCEPADPSGEMALPGSLGALAHTLDAPVIAVVSCAGLGEFELPRIPCCADAILLDECRPDLPLPMIRRVLEVMTRKPVLGALHAQPEARAALRRVGTLGFGLDTLGNDLLGTLDESRLFELARRQEFPAEPPPACVPARARPLRVGFAHDEAFHNFYPETLELFDDLGVETVDFSPLADEQLPPGCDLVLIGCGRPEAYADELYANASFIASLRSYVNRFGRVYAEGAGVAYLCRSMRVGGETLPGAGVLPADAVMRDDSRLSIPVERRLREPTWLGPVGSTVRGYRTGRWALSSLGGTPNDDAYRILAPERDMVQYRQLVGSLVHLHLASMPAVVEAMLEPSIAP